MRLRTHVPLALPDEDRAVLQDLPRSEIGRWASARAKQYGEYAGSLRSLQNTATPIHDRLPIEVLLQIFAFVLPSESQRAIRVGVMYVCRYWRAAIMKTPEFWADFLSILSVYGDKNFLQRALARSTSRLFEVTPMAAGRGHDVILLPLMAPHLHRIHCLNLRITAEYYRGLLHPLLREGGFCNLCTLLIVAPPLTTRNVNHHSPALGGDCHFPDAALPRLEMLKIPWAFFSPPYLAVASLRSLHIQWHALSDLTTQCMQALLDGLSYYTQRLKTLQMECAGGRGLRAPSAREIFFPALRELTIDARSSNTVRTLLESIRFPTAACVHLRIENNNRPVLRRALPDVYRSGHLAHTAEQLRIQQEFDHLYVQASVGNKQLLDIDVSFDAYYPHEPRDSMRNIPSVFAGVGTTRSLDLRFPIYLPNRHTLSLILGAFPSLNDLHLGTICCFPDDFRAHRKTLRALGDASGTPPCPALASLTVVVDHCGAWEYDYGRVDDLADTIVSVLQRRQAVLHRPLRSLTLECIGLNPSSSTRGDPINAALAALTTRVQACVEEISIG